MREYSMFVRPTAGWRWTWPGAFTRLATACLIAAFFFGSLLATPSHAISALQLYIDGATYDSDTETWITTSTTFDLWVIGDVGGHGNISDVKLSAAYVTDEAGSLGLTATTTTVVTDPSTPVVPSSTAGGGDGAIPELADGSALPTHGIYGPGVSFLEWGLGDFTLTDSPVGDFINAFPTAFPSTGQINVYNVTLSGYPSGIHFDVYNTIEGKPHATFGPFSHDSEGASVPEPSTALLLGLGMLAVGLLARTFRHPEEVRAIRVKSRSE